MKTGMALSISLCVCALLAFSWVGRADWLVSSERIVLSVHRPEETRSEVRELTLPYAVGQTGLVVQELTSYEGPFLEDGSYEEVVDVAALLVSNTTNHIMESVEILVVTERETICFTGTWLPPNSTCVLLSRDKNTYLPLPVLEISAQAEQTNIIENNDTLSWTEQEDGIHLTNMSSRDIYGIRILFKTFLQQTGQYIGGVTNKTVLDCLPAGETAVLLPPYYVRNYAKVVLVEITK